jgi:DNA-binding NtrC family response regulator
MVTTIQILMVDDEFRFLNTLAGRLQIRDFEVVTATNGHDALDKARGLQLDIALIDLKMPGMDGEALLKRLKEEHPLMEVIVLTGHGSASSRRSCEEMGSYFYLHKPCETEELVAVLRGAFEKRMMRRLNLKRKELELLIQRSVGESSFQAILRLKALEEQLLKRQRQPSQDSKDSSPRVD